MSKTKSDLATAVLRELRIVRRAGGVPNAADSQFVQDKYSSLFLELKDRDKVFWDDEDSIPERAFDALTMVVAGTCAAAFGRPDYNPGDAMRRLSILTARVPTGYPTKAKYY